VPSFRRCVDAIGAGAVGERLGFWSGAVTGRGLDEQWRQAREVTRIIRLGRDRLRRLGGTLGLLAMAAEAEESSGGHSGRRRRRLMDCDRLDGSAAGGRPGAEVEDAADQRWWAGCAGSDQPSEAFLEKLLADRLK